MNYEDYLFNPFLFEEEPSLSLGNILQFIGPQIFFLSFYLILSVLVFTDTTLKDITLEDYVKIFFTK